MKEKNLLDNEIQLYMKNIDTIDDFMSQNAVHKDTKNQTQLNRNKMFNLMDIIVIDGDPTILPWSLSAIKINKFLLKCLKSNKRVFCTTFATNCLIYLCASNIETRIKILNGNNGSQFGDFSNIKKSLDQIE